MAYRVKIDMPNVPKYADLTDEQRAEGFGIFEVANLGFFENGTTTDVTDDQVAMWQYNTGKTWPEDGTLVLDASESDTQRKTALEDLRKNDPEVYTALMKDIARQKMLESGGTKVAADAKATPAQQAQADKPSETTEG